MAAIYDKALKRKDFSGIVDKDKIDEAKERKKSPAGSWICFRCFLGSNAFLGQIKRRTKKIKRRAMERTTRRLGLMLGRLSTSWL